MLNLFFLNKKSKFCYFLKNIISNCTSQSTSKKKKNNINKELFLIIVTNQIDEL